MTVFTMVALIVCFSIVGGVLNTWIKSKEKREQGEKTSTATNARIRQLEERVQVLERLATDRRERLKDEIDAL